MVLGAITEFGNVGIAQGQANNATSTLTPQQRAVICSPTDKFVNDTESAICGIPATPTPRNTTTSAANARTERAALRRCESQGFSLLYCQYFHGLK